MLVYRIAKEKYIRDISGKGAELAGGRWNPKGIPALYTSSTLSLCMCEVLVHTDKDIPPRDMFFAEISIPDEFVSEKYFSSISLQSALQCGTDWLKTMTSLAIKVPSALMPSTYRGDFNVIVNPFHHDFLSVKIERIEPCNFDIRFF